MSIESLLVHIFSKVGQCLGTSTIHGIIKIKSMCSVVDYSKTPVGIVTVDRDKNIIDGGNVHTFTLSPAAHALVPSILESRVEMGTECKYSGK